MYTAHFRVLKNMLCHNEIIIQSRRSQISDFQTQILLGKCFISLQAEFFLDSGRLWTEWVSKLSAHR